MATFTIELRDVIRNIYNDSSNPDDWVQQYSDFKFNESTYGKLPTVPDPILMGLGTYPIFNEEYRSILNGKIIDEYFTREIGTETIDNWTLMIRRKMDQIMPYYNKLYLSEEIPYTALDTMRIQSIGKAKVEEDITANNVSTTNTETEGKGRAVQSQTPQTMLSGNEDYATAASDTSSDNVTKGTAEAENKSDSTTDSATENLVTGYQAAASDLINKYRASLLNIDTSVILELQDCFMLLLNNGDSYTNSNNYYGWAY
jgi:hypothetical protein